MSTDSIQHTSKIADAVEYVVSETGGRIRLGMPLGLGKPNQFVNALYDRACQDQNIDLEIYTALSLGRPAAGSDLEKRFLKPFADRVFGDYAELHYLRDVRAGKLPDNVRVFEFFFQPGSMLSNKAAQQHYISSNYTHVARDLNARGVNVVAQLVASSPDHPGQLSLSCNPEVALDLMPLLEQRRRQGETIIGIAQVHHHLPWMENDAVVDEHFFDFVVDDREAQSALFVTPNMPVTLQDHLVGLHASTLLRDGGLIQIGIGALGDALVHHAILRHGQNKRYQEHLHSADIDGAFAGVIDACGGTSSFEQGLYGCSEMFTHGLMSLVDAGVIRRRVYQDEDIQRLVNDGVLVPPVTPAWLDTLVGLGLLDSPLEQSAIDWLERAGLIGEGADADGEVLQLVDGSRVSADLTDERCRQAIAELIEARAPAGTLMHGGFYLGPSAFYQRLRELDPALRRSINMTHISYINHLYGDEQLKRLQRRDGRFFNTAFTATLLGAAASDQIESGQVLSGVGGQYNFVSQAHALDGARSILMLRAWRERSGEAMSNLVWRYGHATIPRHLRDIYVTEYGIADLRGRSDAEVVMAMLNIADSRFQSELIEEAVKAGKLPAGYRVPERFRYNTPERLEGLRKALGEHSLPRFPLGCDFTETEQRLIGALGWLKETVGHKEYLRLGRQALFDAAERERYLPHLERMGLAKAGNMRERLYQRLLLAALKASE